MATQVSCDWWRAGHETSCSSLIGPGGGRQGHGEERGAGPGLAAPGHRAALLHGQALRNRQLLRGHSFMTLTSFISSFHLSGCEPSTPNARRVRVSERLPNRAVPQGHSSQPNIGRNQPSDADVDSKEYPQQVERSCHFLPSQLEHLVILLRSCEQSYIFY